MKDVAIIGAGPYGLSLAAHLAPLGVDFSIFGKPMEAWTDQMPPGMRLKSEGFASNLYDPEGAFTLKAYCQANAIPYADIGLPVALETFSAYGHAFQRRFAAGLVQKSVTALTRSPQGWELQLDDNSSVSCRQVIVATGIAHFGHMAPVLAGLPPALVSHSGKHGDLSGFSGKRVAVIGAGASALDLAALLHQKGAEVTVICRSPKINFHTPPRKRTLIAKIRRPMTGLGPNWESLAYVKAPLVFHVLPESVRLRLVNRHLGPAPGWFIRQDVEGKVRILLESSVSAASSKGGAACLTVSRSGEPDIALDVDHVISATGYKVDLERLKFLGPEIRGKIRLEGQSPALDSYFESSVPGLYFVGVTGAYSFGPMLRFAYGAGFTSRRLSRRLARGPR